jgi:hypothetical protein
VAVEGEFSCCASGFSSCWLSTSLLAWVSCTPDARFEHKHMEERVILCQVLSKASTAKFISAFRMFLKPLEIMTSVTKTRFYWLYTDPINKCPVDHCLPCPTSYCLFIVLPLGEAAIRLSIWKSFWPVGYCRPLYVANNAHSWRWNM